MKISKSEAKKEIEDFFSDINSKTPKEVKKIKKLAMRCNIPLKEKRKLFCKKCLMPYIDSSIKIKEGKIIITCGNCDFKNKWKIN